MMTPLHRATGVDTHAQRKRPNITTTTFDYGMNFLEYMQSSSTQH